MTVWCQDNNLSPQCEQDKGDDPELQEKDGPAHPHSHRRGCSGEGRHHNKLSWSKHTKTVVKRARQRLFPLRRLKRFGMGPSDPQNVPQLHYREHPGCITACYGKCLASDRKVLQRVVRTAQYITQYIQASCHPGPLYQAVSEESPKNCQRLQSP